MSHDEIEKLWEKYYNGDTSAQEEKVLRNFLREHRENERFPERALFSLMDENRDLHLSGSFDDDLMSKIQPSKTGTIIFPFNWIAWKWAAAIVLLCITVYAVTKIIDGHVIHLVTAQSPKEFHLPDGSTVWLNSNSRLSYGQDFLQERTVQFTGEGFFDIAHDPSHPFRIETKNTITQVVGTSFNLRSYAKENSIELLVVEGKVSFHPDNASELIVSGRHRAVYNVADQRTSEFAAPDLNAIAWKTHVLNFVDAPISKVLNDLQRYNGVTISVENEKVLNCHFSGTFENKTIEEILATLTFSLDLEYHKIDNAYRLFGNGCAAK